MKKLRKAFVVSVMSITVLSMSMVAVPMQVGAAAQAGDLIKMDGLSSVYYLGADGKRYVFPNEATYFSWYSDFSGVVTIPQAELESYPLGKNITVRPGTKLVKITTNPKVYAVEPNGQLVAIPDEATAAALYGANWAQRIVDIPDSFFTNYDISSKVASSSAYPAGSLIKFAGSEDVYYIAEDGSARMIADEAVMAANRFRMSDVISATISMPSVGSPITGAETALTDTSSGAGGVANAGTGLSVSLSSTTAASASLPSLSYLVPFMSVKLTAAADGAVTVNQMTFRRGGTGAYGDFDGGYLYVGDERLSSKRSVTSDNLLTFTALGLNIPAGSSKVVTLKMNATTLANSSHYFSLVSASSISTNGAVVSGSFPISGNTMSYNADVDAGSITFDGAANAPTYKVGETGVILGEFDITTGSGEDLDLHSLMLKQSGTAAANAVSNISVEIDNVVEVEGLSVSSDKYLTIPFDEAYRLDKNTTVTVTIRGDIITDITKTVEFILKNDGDVVVTGTAYGNNYSPSITRTDFDASADVDTCTIQGSDIDVSFDGPLASDIKDNTKEVVFANFKIKSNSEDVNIDSIRVVLTNGSNDTTDLPDNIEMVDETNNVSYTVSDPTSYDGNYYANLDFENIYLTKGVQYNFEIRGDIPDSGTTGQTYTVSIDLTDSTNTFTAYFQDADETAVAETNLSSSTLTGKAMTIAAPAVTLSPVTTTASTYVENTKKVLLYKGKITANAVSDLKISKLSFDGVITTATYWGDAFDRLYLYLASDDMGTPLKDISSLTTTADPSFSGFTLNVPAGTSNGVYIVVRGDVKNNPTTGTFKLRWHQTYTSNYTVKDSDNDAVTTNTIGTGFGQTSTIAGSGTFTMAFDSTISGLNSAKNVLAGEEVLVGRIKLTAQNEEVNLEDFTLDNIYGTATADDIAALKLYNDAAMTSYIGEATLDSSKRALFSDINIKIPSTGSKYVYVSASLKGVDYSNSPTPNATATASRTITLDIASTTVGAAYDVKAVGVSTGDELSNTGVASTTQTIVSTILGATVSNITSAFSNGLLSAGTKDIFSFKVTAPESNNIDYDSDALGIKLATTTFTIASSSGLTLTGFKIERVGGAAGEKDAMYITSATDTAVGSGTFVINFPDTFGTSNDLIVRPGETAEYVVRATVGGVSANSSLQISLENLGSNVNFTHNYATTGGTLAGQTAAVYTKLPGVTYVRGGSLTN